MSVRNLPAVSAAQPRKFTFATAPGCGVDEVEVSTVVYAPPEEMFEFLVDFPNYARYSEYIDRVEQDGEGGSGTRYDLVFSWWKLTYTARSEVTGTDRPSRIDWRIVKDIDAVGYWGIEDATDEAPDDVEAASRIVLDIEFDPDSAASDAVDLPRLVSMGWVVEKVKPLVKQEATRIVERVVADIEGEPRDVDLRIRTGPDAV